MKKSLFSKFYILHGDNLIDDKIKSRLMKIYRLYSSSKKLWNEKNFRKMHLIADKYLN